MNIDLITPLFKVSFCRNHIQLQCVTTCVRHLAFVSNCLQYEYKINIDLITPLLKVSFCRNHIELQCVTTCVRKLAFVSNCLQYENIKCICKVNIELITPLWSYVNRDNCVVVFCRAWLDVCTYITNPYKLTKSTNIFFLQNFQFSTNFS